MLLLGAASLPAADSAPPAASMPTAEQIAHINTAIIPEPTLAPARHAGFVTQAQKGGIDVLFLGDSITDWWQTNGKDVFAKYFGGWKIANFGIAAETTQQVLWRLQNGEGAGFQPKVVMLMIGTNNLHANSDEQIVVGVAVIVRELRKDFPNAKILLLGIFPRGQASDLVRNRVATINEYLATLNDLDHVFYLDIGRKFLDAQGNFLPDVFLPDLLHPAPKGYEIWAEAVKAPLENLLKLQNGTPAK
ncbi:MAG TPA: GDSL-type esterase/lipase family protein [Opitutales bacterium]|nr:GDSL-type esterase/lipase family protein [Opitutales bacterium]